MARKHVHISETPLYSDNLDREIDGISAACSDCGHSTESLGTSSASIRRCLALMRESCPRGENNYYTTE